MNSIQLINPDIMYTSEEVTEYLRVSLRTTQRLLKSGLLSSFKIHGQYRIKGIDILNYLNQVRVDINDSAYEQENNKPIKLVNLLAINPIEINLNVELAKKISENEQEFLDRISLFREKMTLDMGFISPGIRFSDNSNLDENNFKILIHGIDIYKDKAENLDDLLNKIEKIIKKYSYEIISREEVAVILDNLRKVYPVIIEEVIADDYNFENKISIGQLTKILQSLLKEQISIRNMKIILESIADIIPFSKSHEIIVNKVRENLSRQICSSLTSTDIIDVITLSDSLENQLIASLKEEKDGSTYLAIDYKIATQIREKLALISKDKNNSVILCNQDIRRHLKDLLERHFPDINLISYREVAKEYRIKEIHRLALDA